MRSPFGVSSSVAFAAILLAGTSQDLAGATNEFTFPARSTTSLAGGSQNLAGATIEFTPLFPKDGVPEGWTVRAWDDVSKPGPGTAVWKVQEGVLHGSEPRGTWLMSDKEYGDFILEFEFKLGERGNSGCAIRAPMKGDPAFDGMEVQMADVRYNPDAKDSELTGGIYRAIAPSKQVYRPTEWNSYQITIKGDRLKVVLNGQTIQDVNLANETAILKRHNRTDAPALNERPTRGHIGFQELSRGGDHVQIRNARMKVFN